MRNIKFNYLYRDASNYKQFGYVVFSNPNNITLSYIERNLRINLADGEYFFVDVLGIPSLFFNEINGDDHMWHEFESIEMTDEKANMKISIQDFLHLLKAKQLN